MKSREEQILKALDSSRKYYENALMELIQFYLDIGYQLRLQNARKELKALKKVPQPKYLMVKEKAVKIKPSKNIEEANILFQDGKMYKNSLSPFKKKTKLISALDRFEKLLNDYPESDKVSEAAYEIAEIYESLYFKDYESSVAYYVKSYELNPNTEKPARYMAARVYDLYLKDYASAVQYYELASKMCKNEDYKKIAASRLDELRKQGY
ncbi:MAG: tol-pal system YbgF family protein [Candidatus Scalinduaceae bacterium]